MPNNGVDPAMTGIWGELNKVLGGLDLNNDHNGHENGMKTANGSNSALNGGHNGQPSFLSIGSRSSLDLGTLGRSENSTGKSLVKIENCKVWTFVCRFVCQEFVLIC